MHMRHWKTDGRVMRQRGEVEAKTEAAKEMAADGEQGRTRELQQHRRPGTRGHFCVKLHLRPTQDDH